MNYLEQLEATVEAASDPLTLIEVMRNASDDELEARVADWCRCTQAGAQAVLNMRIESLIPQRADRLRRAARDLRTQVEDEPR